jgi:hypothetical protein
LFSVDQFVTDQLLKEVMFVSVTAMRCGEYFVHLVQREREREREKDLKRRHMFS